MKIFGKPGKDRLAIIGMVIIFFLMIVAVLAPYIAPYHPLELDMKERLLSPSLRHPMGTDSVGRDVLSRIIHGTRISLLIAVIVVITETVVGVLVGTAAGYLGRTVDEILMRLVDILMAFPGIILSMAIMGIMGTSLINLIISMTSVGWVRYARVFRGEILSVKQEMFIESARAVGCSRMRIVIRHILPNTISPIIVLATMNMGAVIISIAGLGFLGLGVQPPTPEWGIMLSEGKPFMESACHLMIFPGLMIMLTVMAFNFLGDGLRDILDVRMKEY
ncbi:MAG: ABC transporter permease [Desulfobacteraceae bacterium]|nr:ABC transporter permease [Desulfobacteraceae bacterium]